MQGSRESQARERIGLRGVIEARRYSPRQNLDYVRLAFISPRRLLEEFLLETSLLYGLVPFTIFVIAYEFLYIWNYLQQRPLAFARLLPIPEPAYYLYQALFAPLINAADALYIRFLDTTVTTEHLAEGIAADYDANGRLAGIEILDALKRFDDPQVLRQVILEDVRFVRS